MGKHRPILAVMLAALTVSCAVGMSAGARRLYVDDHPQLAAQIKDAILRGELAVGMTESDVVAAIGSPNDIHRATYEWGTTAQFVYAIYGFRYVRPKYAYVYFENGRVTGWQQ